MTQLGNNLVTNSTFDTPDGWQLGSGWSIAGGVASGVESGSFLAQELGSLINLEKYRLEFNAVLNSSAAVVSLANSNQYVIVDGANSLDLTVSTESPVANKLLRFQLIGGAGPIQIDNVSVRQFIDHSGQLGQLIQVVADKLDALQYNGSTVFKTADRWRHQVSFRQGGIQDFGRYAPFAFVGYMSCDAGREGGYDLKQTFLLAVLIGQEHRTPGVACWGDSTHLGTSKIRELVIEALDQVHPGASFDCDDMEYDGEEEWVDNETMHGIRLYFRVPSMAVTQPKS